MKRKACESVDVPRHIAQLQKTPHMVQSFVWYRGPPNDREFCSMFEAVISRGQWSKRRKAFLTARSHMHKIRTRMRDLCNEPRWDERGARITMRDAAVDLFRIAILKPASRAARRRLQTRHNIGAMSIKETIIRHGATATIDLALRRKSVRMRRDVMSGKNDERIAMMFVHELMSATMLLLSDGVIAAMKEIAPFLCVRVKHSGIITWSCGSSDKDVTFKWRGAPSVWHGVRAKHTHAELVATHRIPDVLATIVSQYIGDDVTQHTIKHLTVPELDAVAVIGEYSSSMCPSQ